jgi:hypothetical protein
MESSLLAQVEKIRESEIISDNRLDNLTQRYMEEQNHHICSGIGFVDYLEQNGCLTRWQADKLRQGKCKGFRFDNYLLLSLVEVRCETSLFLAVDVDTQRHVHIEVDPRRPNPNHPTGMPPYVVTPASV